MRSRAPIFAFLVILGCTIAVAQIEPEDILVPTDELIVGNADGRGESSATIPAGAADHGGLTGLDPDDDHGQYFFLAGRSGGQSAIGGTAAGENITFIPTSHATGGSLFVTNQAGDLWFDVELDATPWIRIGDISNSGAADFVGQFMEIERSWISFYEGPTGNLLLDMDFADPYVMVGLEGQGAYLSIQGAGGSPADTTQLFDGLGAGGDYWKCVSAECIFNDGSTNARNFRVETDTNIDMLEVRGTAEEVHIGKLNVNDAYTFPVVDGSANQVLTTDGAAAVSWADPSVGPHGRRIFDTGTTSLPGSTEIRFNNATYGSVTEIFVHATDSDSTEVDGYQRQWCNSATSVAIHAFLTVRKVLDKTIFVIFEIDGTCGIHEVAADLTSTDLDVTYLDGNGTFSDADEVIVAWDAAPEVYVINLPMALTFYEDTNALTTEQLSHGAIAAESMTPPSGAVSSGSPVTFTKGLGKIVFVVNAGSDTAGDLTITGTSVDRNSGTETGSDTDTVTVAGTTTDSTGTDGDSNIVWDFSNAYITSKWFTGAISVATTDLTITDMDIYHVSFEQFNDLSNVELQTLDMNAYAVHSAAKAYAHLYTVVVSGDTVVITSVADIEWPASKVNANHYYRLRRGNLGINLDGLTDGIFLQSYWEGVNRWDQITAKVWGAQSVTVAVE